MQMRGKKFQDADIQHSQNLIKCYLFQIGLYSPHSCTHRTGLHSGRLTRSSRLVA